MSASIKSLVDTTSSEYLPSPVPGLFALWTLNWRIYWGHIIDPRIQAGTHSQEPTPLKGARRGAS